MKNSTLERGRSSKNEIKSKKGLRGMQIFELLINKREDFFSFPISSREEILRESGGFKKGPVFSRQMGEHDNDRPKPFSSGDRFRREDIGLFILVLLFRFSEANRKKIGAIWRELWRNGEVFRRRRRRNGDWERRRDEELVDE